MTATGGLKFAGAALLVAAGWLLGRHSTDALRRRAALLRSISVSLGVMADELAALSTPLPLIFERLRGRPFFELLAAGFGGEPLPQLWRRAAEAQGFDAKDTEALSSLGAVVGRYDAPRQAAEIALVRRELDGSAAAVERELSGRAGSYAGLGAACGAILAVILF